MKSVNKFTRTVKAHGIALSSKDIEKLAKIQKAEEIQSRSETIRRLIDLKFQELEKNEKSNPA